MTAARVPSSPQSASRHRERRLDLDQTRAELAGQFIRALLLLLPMFVALRFLAFREAGHWPLRFFNLAAILGGVAALYLGRRRLDSRAGVHGIMALSLGFWVQQLFLVGPMELGTVALALMVPLAAGLLLGSRAGWGYALGMTGVVLAGAGMDLMGWIPPFPYTQGWGYRRFWDYWMPLALGIPVLCGAFLAAIRRLFRNWERLVLDLKREMADRVQLQEQLLQARKLESVGRLAGGVAHDVNNMISTVLGHAYLIELDLPPDDPLRENLRGICQAGQRSGEIVRQLLFFARQQPGRPEALDLNARIREARNLITPLMGAGIRIQFKAGEDLWEVAIDPTHLDQILVNLAVNARDAMPGGGTLTLETANVSISEAECRTRVSAAPGPHVLLTVGDEGTGMDPATLERIFEPFFTTKEPGKGTGLGLATVLGIVQQAGGFIEVRTGPGAGTTFQVFLPTFSDPAAGGQPYT